MIVQYNVKLYVKMRYFDLILLILYIFTGPNYFNQYWVKISTLLIDRYYLILAIKFPKLCLMFVIFC